MADRYWVNGSGTWNAVNTANWSATNGGPGGASVPTSSDKVFITPNSSASTPFSVAIVNTVTVLAFEANTGNCTITDGGSGKLVVTSTPSENCTIIIVQCEVPVELLFSGTFTSLATAALITTFTQSIKIQNARLSTSFTTTQTLYFGGNIRFTASITINCRELYGTSTLSTIFSQAPSPGIVNLNGDGTAGPIYSTTASSSLTDIFPNSLRIVPKIFPSTTSREIYAAFPNQNNYLEIILGGDTGITNNFLAIDGTVFPSLSRANVGYLTVLSTYKGTILFRSGLNLFGDIDSSNSTSQLILSYNGLPCKINNSQGANSFITGGAIVQSISTFDIEGNSAGSCLLKSSNLGNIVVNHYNGNLTLEDITINSYLAYSTATNCTVNSNLTINNDWDSSALVPFVNFGTSNIDWANPFSSGSFKTKDAQVCNNLNFSGAGFQQYTILSNCSFNNMSSTRTGSWALEIDAAGGAKTVLVNNWNVNGYNNASRVNVRTSNYSGANGIIKNNTQDSIINYADITNITGSSDSGKRWFRTPSTSESGTTTGFILLSNNGAFFFN